MLARKAELNKAAAPASRMSATRAALERQKLVHARELAQRRRDFAESAELDRQIAAHDAMNVSCAVSLDIAKMHPMSWSWIARVPRLTGEHSY